MTTVQRALLIIVLLAVPASGLWSQERATPVGSDGPRELQRKPSFARIYTDNPQVAYVLVPSIPDGARTVVVRRAEANGVPANLILVTRETTPADVVKALSVLAVSRINYGEVIPADRELRSNVDQGSAETAARSRNLQVAQKYLARVREAQPMSIPRIGSHPIAIMNLRPIAESMRRK